MSNERILNVDFQWKRIETGCVSTAVTHATLTRYTVVMKNTMDLYRYTFLFCLYIYITVNFVSAIMLTLFDDWHKLKGLNMKSNSREDLQEALQTSNTLDSLISLFEL